MNDHHAEISPEENLNKEVDELSCVWPSLGLFPQLLLSYSNESVFHWLSHMTSEQHC